MSTASPHVEQLVQQGMVAAREGRHGAAQQALREAVRLSPNHEQAWLWLSGVEDNDPARLAALREVLRINPQSQAAQRGIDHLSRPTQVDLSGLLPAASPPPPARAGWSPPPAKAAPVAPISPPLAATTHGVPAPTAQPAAPPASAAPPDAEQQVDPDMVADLRPAITKAAQKRRFLPRSSEVGILALLVALLFGFFFGARYYLRGRVPEDVSENRNIRPTSVLYQGQNPPPAQAVTNPATAVPVPVAESGIVYTSRSYALKITGTGVDQSGQVTTISVELSNPGRRPVGFRARDFSLFNSVNSRLTLDSGGSDLFAGRSDADLQIPAGGVVSGSITFKGNASRSPLTVGWQPFNGGVTEYIVVR
jgi:hypothetical protein